ncbi:hypothetical protein AY601_2017 [Pedobacter cryoconitis]|uniref:DUF4145 domain-containing protein n=1 Tax=Pedobacter cryoconitis TaxID=188932 RepID=A0A127VC43_9SPHI|nr:hypothetical protein [Pedobacter cryoconitis]AMP98923.1 hypothetical protein AY601_2017 [Pedobacter cryoconitis]
MASNIDRYKSDLDKLLKLGKDLFYTMQNSVFPKETIEHLKSTMKSDEEVAEYIKQLPNFKTTYQRWYSESIVLIKQILPDRLQDFIKYYEKPKGRKLLEFENYTIEDYLQGNFRNSSYTNATSVSVSAAIPQFQQQLSILRSIKGRFESTLFDIRQLVHADFLDSELAVAKELLKHKFARAAGAVAGVVLEKHLFQVISDRKIAIKKNPSINDLNEALKKSGVIDTPQWRSIQLLGDLRNKCSHSKASEPTAEDVEDLIAGVDKTIKTVF